MPRSPSRKRRPTTRPPTTPRSPLPANRPPFAGLTGGIGSGKSEALAALERLGAATLSSDAVVHGLYAEDDLIAAVTGRWGDEVAPGGVVDRGEVAKKAFASEEERKWLESQIWPRVGEKVAEFLESNTGLDDPPRALVIEVPLLFESGLDRGYDATIAVIADEEVRAQRAGARGHEAVDERTKAQLTQEEKAARATYVVHNDGSIEDLERALSDVLDRLTAADP